ncbi:MAG: C39 family peptidase [Clostridiales bacterium]|nr:C39 family peptidase [Clostridiales bacterium]
MHPLKYLTVFGLCGMMLATQPAIDYITQVYAETASEASTEASDTSSSSNTDATESESEATASTTAKSEDSSSDTAGEDSSNKNSDSTTATSSGSTSSSSNTGKSSSDTSSSDSTSATSSKKSSKSTKKKSKSTFSSDEESSTESDDSSEKEVIDLDEAGEIDEEDSADTDSTSSEIIPEIYGTSEIITRDDAEYIGDFVYFNQTDSMWNDNGYQIASAGCGPTSMAVVISSLTDEWVTPLDAAVWGYEHGYYSSDGSSHYLISAMAEAYGLECEGVGTDYEAIKDALNEGNPVVVLMGPGYFTKKGHFMVLVDIDENDNVTVADVASRTRSSYKYSLSDIISQSKSANAGGPFWVISNPNMETKDTETTEKTASETSVTYSSPTSSYVIYVTEDGEKKQITFQLGDKISYNGTTGLIVKFDHRKAYVLGEDGEYLATDDGSETIPLSDVTLLQSAPKTIYSAMVSYLDSDGDSVAQGYKATSLIDYSINRADTTTATLTDTAKATLLNTTTAALTDQTILDDTSYTEILTLYMMPSLVIADF